MPLDPQLTAVVAVAVAVLALVGVVVALLKLRRLRAQQSAVLGDKTPQDLVAHAAALSADFQQLHGYMSTLAEDLTQRVGLIQERLDSALTKRALVRYDAYGELSGRQSSSLVLLDDQVTGLVISSIVHRDIARIYVKTVNNGVSDLPLSPEEQQAIDAAMTGETVLIELEVP